MDIYVGQSRAIRASAREIPPRLPKCGLPAVAQKFFAMTRQSDLCVTFGDLDGGMGV
jgi:hypothetical protein